MKLSAADAVRGGCCCCCVSGGGTLRTQVALHCTKTDNRSILVHLNTLCVWNMLLIAQPMSANFSVPATAGGAFCMLCGAGNELEMSD